MNLRDFHFIWKSTNTSYLLQALLLVFSAQGSCFCKEHFTPRWQVGSQKSKGIIYRKVKGKHYNMSPLRGFEPQAVSPNKVIPAGWRVSCAPLSACLYSRPEERRSEDYPRWTVWNDLIDFYEDWNLRSTDFAVRYSTCWHFSKSCPKYKRGCANDHKIQTPDLPMVLSDNIPADVYESCAVTVFISHEK